MLQEESNSTAYLLTPFDVTLLNRLLYLFQHPKKSVHEEYSCLESHLTLLDFILMNRDLRFPPRPFQHQQKFVHEEFSSPLTSVDFFSDEYLLRLSSLNNFS
ncbi:hypothetical protein AVEN_233225-1 [Araneus ventricosus]|uniref:Uncharacterized protein n=1 Tax=Araneus ventricosus TaxID=182803 RepID=A0A4Y2EMI8_ARAVE|nr:hypothetical protein AVEN_233225-1 [Araneus ventricosus]